MAKIGEIEAVGEILSEERQDEIGMAYDRLYARLSDISSEIANKMDDMVANWKSWSIVTLTIHIESMQALYSEKQTIKRVLDNMDKRYPDFKPF